VAGEYIEAWRHLKGWYCFVKDQSPKPCTEMLAKQTQQRVNHAAQRSLGWLLPINVDPDPVPDAIPIHLELQLVVG
jgi:hypothetical protein